MSVFTPPPAELIPPLIPGIRVLSFLMLPAEFKDGATAKIMVPAPGPNRVVIPLSWSMMFQGSGVGYTNNQSFRCRYFGSASELLSVGTGIVTVTGTSNIFTGVQVTSAFTLTTFDPRNVAVVCRCLNTFTGGAASDRMFFTFSYYIAEFHE